LLKVGGLEIDQVRRCVSRKGEQVKLTPKECELLLFLARHAGKVLTHQQILTTVWGQGHEGDIQYLRVYIGHLRQKIEEQPENPCIIMTELGVGYRVAEGT
jgi:two-component system KDP operon response regulator KdpE